MVKVAAERPISAVFFSDLPAPDLHQWGRPSQELRIRRVDPKPTEPYNSGVSPFDHVTPLATSEDAWLAVSQEVETIADKLCEARSFCVYLAEGMGGSNLTRNTGPLFVPGRQPQFHANATASNMTFTLNR